MTRRTAARSRPTRRFPARSDTPATTARSTIRPRHDSPRAATSRPDSRLRHPGAIPAAGDRVLQAAGRWRIDSRLESREPTGREAHDGLGLLEHSLAAPRQRHGALVHQPGQRVPNRPVHQLAGRRLARRWREATRSGISPEPHPAGHVRRRRGDDSDPDRFVCRRSHEARKARRPGRKPFGSSCAKAV